MKRQLQDWTNGVNSRSAALTGEKWQGIMPSSVDHDIEYRQQLAAMVAGMPQGRRAKIQWYRERRCRPDIDQRALRHAFWGHDLSWDDDRLPSPDPEYLRGIEPGWMWVRVDRNTKANYVTSGYALNLSNPDADLGPADWHQACWQTPLKGAHPRARDCIGAQYHPLRGKGHYHETWTALGDRGVFDARPSFREFGHPAGNRPAVVWAADHPRAIIDQAWDTLARRAASRRVGDIAVEDHVTPYLVARWLWTDAQFDELMGMAASVEESIAGAHVRDWRQWMSTLSPEAAWSDDLNGVPKAATDASHAPSP